MGDTSNLRVIKNENTCLIIMKEQLESNVITKYAAGLMSKEESRKLEDWLKQNPQFMNTVAIIQQQVRAMSSDNLVLTSK